ncbi:hypothetical protein ETD86_07865 [Nonomuraea turkmeniaca]|uniref:Uncharacterized protein n=1 Tax=Nonomuraea turkmeniaca TaxID=103838 RepID=A0A5S4FSC5_9ACTN|nr:hypothetical protein ETD86_07865 [Nonomuraea turkmeniaca]
MSGNAGGDECRDFSWSGVPGSGRSTTVAAFMAPRSWLLAVAAEGVSAAVARTVPPSPSTSRTPAARASAGADDLATRRDGARIPARRS